MTTEVEVKMPKLGESIVSATIVHWFKKVGDRVAVDEPLLEVSTDKVNSEIPSPVAGVVKELRGNVDETLDVGALICIVETADGAEASASAPVEATPAAPSCSGGGDSKRNFYSPAVLRFAQDNGVSMAQLDEIPRSGAGGRLSRKDIENFLSGQQAEPGQERVKMTGMRKAIAEQMVKSFYEAPHASLVADVDITKVMDHIKATKESFQAEYGYKLTITTYIARAIAKAAMEFPYCNASLDGDEIVLKKFVNLGIAVSVDQAIVVPVVRNVHKLSVPEIAGKIAELAGKAKEKKLQPDDVQAGTITMSNFGMGGALIGVPIIRYPEVAIIGVGKIDRRLAVMDDDSTAIRSIVHLTLTFDHRAIDGMYGCEFLAAVKKHLESDL